MGQIYENDTTAKLTTALERSCNVIVFKVHGHAMQKPGWPDFYIACPTFQGWIEAKGPTTVLRPLQVITIKRLKEKGVNVFVLRYADEHNFIIEDEEGTMLKQFSFQKWSDGASALLQNLQELTLGTRESSTVSNTLR